MLTLQDFSAEIKLQTCVMDIQNGWRCTYSNYTIGVGVANMENHIVNIFFIFLHSFPLGWYHGGWWHDQLSWHSEKMAVSGITIFPLKSSVLARNFGASSRLLQRDRLNRTQQYSFCCIQSWVCQVIDKNKMQRAWIDGYFCLDTCEIPWYWPWCYCTCSGRTFCSMLPFEHMFSSWQ